MGIKKTVVAALGVVALVMPAAACGSELSTQSPTVAIATATTAAVVRDLTVETPNYLFAVTKSAVDVSRHISAEATGTSTNTPDFLTSDQPGVEVDFGDHTPPNAPVTLTFDMSKDTSFTSSTTLLPAIVSQTEGSTELEVLTSQWNSSTHTLTAQTPHLSTFWPTIIDVDALRTRLDGAAKGYLGLTFPKPDCVGKPAVSGSLTYTLDPAVVSSAWPCISATSDSIAVELHSNSGNGYRVTSTPVTTNMSAAPDASVEGVADQIGYSALFAAALGTGTFLSPGGVTTLTFPAAEPPQQIAVSSDAGATLLRTLLFGLNQLYPNSKLLEIPSVGSCVTTLYQQIRYIDDPAGSNFGNLANGLTDCVTVAVKNLGGKGIVAVANSSIGSILSMIPDAASLLYADVRGIAAPFTGESNQVITVRTSQGPAAASTAPALIQLVTERSSNGAGYPEGPNQYRISDTSKHNGVYYADINYIWHITRPPDSDLGNCKAHVRLLDEVGNQLAQFDGDDFNACTGGGTDSTSTELTKPGKYKFVMDLEFSNAPTQHAEQAFVLNQ